jgi:hypothetical protein
MQATVVAYSKDVNLGCLLALDAAQSIGRQVLVIAASVSRKRR